MTLAAKSTEFRIFPAIDLLDGQSVRLQKGKRQSAHTVHADPIEQIMSYVSAGAQCVHIVNLNAAFDDIPSHDGFCKTNRVVDDLIAKRNLLGPEKKLVLQVGGGIRSRQAALRLFELGVDRVVVGTWALRNPNEVARLASEFKDRVIVGLDAHHGKLAGQGWTEISQDLELYSFARQLQSGGVAEVLYTQIENDGMLSGVDVDAMANLAKASGLKVLASGGVAGIDDVQKLAARSHEGISGVIVGKALHAGSLRLDDALKYQTVSGVYL